METECCIIEQILTEYCKAKINLTLQITGKRQDGYHLLRSHVVFADDFYDVLTVQKSDCTRLSIKGDFKTAVPSNNSLTQAIDWLEHFYNRSFPVTIDLEKNIPSGAGLGGGSADAAGLVRAIQKLYSLKSIPIQHLVALGADVPVCYKQQACIMEGVGEHITALPTESSQVKKITLINPGIKADTATVFKALNANEWGKNDNNLLAPALRSVPGLKQIYSDLKAIIPPTNFLKMSGSGSTFFTDYPDIKHLQKSFPKYLVKQTTVGYTDGP